ncbi:hypothetical protein AU387_06970 [Bacillus halotolerans]|nr:hypothetical protein AU387_06970 [Bacillus halotolerans]
MNKESFKFILILFAVFAVIQVTNEINFTNYWFIDRLIQFAICIIVFLVMTYIFPVKKTSELRIELH